MRSRENVEDVGAGLVPSAKTEDVIDATTAVSGALRRKVGHTYQMLKVAEKNCCFFWNEAFNELEDLIELESGCTLSKKVNTVLATLR